MQSPADFNYTRSDWRRRGNESTTFWQRSDRQTSGCESGLIRKSVFESRSLLMATRDNRRNIYDKKSQRYTKDNRTAFNFTHWNELLTDTKHRAASLRQQSYLFCLFRVIDWVGYMSAFYCTLKYSILYRIVSHRIIHCLLSIFLCPIDALTSRRRMAIVTRYSFSVACVRDDACHHCDNTRQEALLSQRGRAMLCVCL